MPMPPDEVKSSSSLKVQSSFIDYSVTFREHERENGGRGQLRVAQL